MNMAPPTYIDKVKRLHELLEEAREIAKDIALGGDFQAVELVKAAVNTYSHVEKAATLTVEYLAQLPLISSNGAIPANEDHETGEIG